MNRFGVLAALVLCTWGGYVIGKQVGGWELAASIKAEWKMNYDGSEAIGILLPARPASAPEKRW